MNNLESVKKLQNEDFTIMENGEAYISQRKLAEKCGVTKSTINNAIARKASYVGGWKLNEINQIHADSIPLVGGYYAQQGYKEAAQFLMEIAKAGARAWVYHEAGFEFKVEQKQDIKPMSQLQILAQVAQSLADQEQQLLLVEKHQKEQGEILENVSIKVERIAEDLIPKVQDYDLLTSANGSMTINSFAKVLVGNGINYPDRKLRKWLKDKGYTYSEPSNENQPKSTYVKSGHFKVVNTEGSNKLWYPTTMITPKGQQTIARRIRKEEGTWTK